MIKTLIAYTSEIIDPEVATKEILDQLDITNNILPNSVAIISCTPDFVKFGLVKEICKNLPFSSVGCTTLGNAVKDNYGFLTPIITVTVLTSDDVEFITTLSDGLEKKATAPVENKARTQKLKTSEHPKLILSFMPHMKNIDTGNITSRDERIFESIPIFGSFACDPEADIEGCGTFYNGEMYTTRSANVFIYGNIEPQFFSYSISEKNIRQQSALITKAENFLLKEINNMPFLAYMETVGLAKNIEYESLISIPFIVDFNDGTKPIARSMLGINDDGDALCAGHMPLNETLSIAVLESNDIIEITEQILEKILETRKINGVILFSCVTRNIVLGNDVNAEAAKIFEKLGNDIPYHFSYSGGEICPNKNLQGTLINRIHNCSIIAWVF